MIRISQISYTATGHRLIDCSGKSANFHGHTYKWEVTVSGPKANSEDLKAIVDGTIAGLDHSLILSNMDPLVLKHGENDVRNLFFASDGSMPRLNIISFNPTAKNLAKWQFKRINQRLPIGVDLVGVKCTETENSFCEILPD